MVRYTAAIRPTKIGTRAHTASRPLSSTRVEIFRRKVRRHDMVLPIRVILVLLRRVHDAPSREPPMRLDLGYFFYRSYHINASCTDDQWIMNAEMASIVPIHVYGTTGGLSRNIYLISVQTHRRIPSLRLGGVSVYGDSAPDMGSRP